MSVPEEPAGPFAGAPQAKTAFDKLSYSHQCEYVNGITDAKRPETRQRRAARNVERLSES